MALKWGILGASKIARDFVLAMKTLPAGEHQVVAVGSSTESRAKSFASANVIPKWYGSYEELASDPEIQVIYVAGNSNTHAENCKIALNHKKHVLCEKPFAMNLRETNEILELAKQKKLFIMEAMWTRFLPVYQYLRQELSNNVIGEVRVAMVSFGANLENIPRLQDPKLGGSVLLDLGGYTLNFADIAFGGEKPESIQVSGHLFDSGVDHTGSVTMLFSKKRTAQLLFTGGVMLPNVGTIIGTNGTITVDSFFHAATKITGPSGSKEFPFPDTEAPTNFPNSSGLRYQIDAVRQSIMNGELENKLMPHSTTIRIMEYMDEIRRQLGVRFEQDTK